MLRLEPGDYLVNVTFGRAHLTRKISVDTESAMQERFVLNAGGLRLTPALASGEAINEKAVVYDIYSDERDQYGQRMKVTSTVRPGIVCASMPASTMSSAPTATPTPSSAPT